MKAYILSVIGAAVLAAFAGILAPDKWRKYISIVTGIVIITCIISPITTLVRTEPFRGFDEIEELGSEGEDIQIQMVKEELQKRVADDIEKRLKEEFGISVRAECEIEINGEKEITGIERIYINGKISERARLRLCEVYGVRAGDIEEYTSKREGGA